MRWVAIISLLLASLAASTLAQGLFPQKVEHLGFNVSSVPLDNRTLRQAIVSAIDRQAVFEAARSKIQRGWITSGPAGSWFPPFLRQHRPDVRILPYDVATAKLLLEKAGYPGGQGLPEFEIIYRQDSPFGQYRQAEAEALRAQLLAVGIQVSIRGVATGRELFDRLTSDPPAYQMVLFAWGAKKPEDDFLIPMFLPGSRRNIYRYQNPDVTFGLAALQKEQEPTRRLVLLHAVENQVLTDAPVVPLFYYSSP